MKHVILTAAFAVIAGQAGAQVVQVGRCLAFNDVPGMPVAARTYCAATASTSFVAPSGFMVTHVEVFGTATPNANVSIQDQASGSGAFGSAAPSSSMDAGWMVIPLQNPVTLSAGGSVALAFLPDAPTFPFNTYFVTLHTNPSGTTPFVVNSVCGPGMSASCVAVAPCGGQNVFNLMVRLRGPACSGGVPASVTTIGTGCGTSTPVLSTYNNQVPVVGSQTFRMQLANAGPNGSVVQLYFSFGTNPAGVPLELGHPCRAYLDAASFSANLALGFEPLAVTVVSFPFITFPLPVPDVPAIAGASVTLQALVIGPAGLPLSFAPGILVSGSNAVELRIGL